VPRSQRSEVLARLEALERRSSELIDIGARVRIYRRDASGGEDKAVPDALMPQVYGGLYHPGRRAYIGPPRKPVEFSALPVHRQVIEASERRVLFLGAPGSGKTEEAVLLAVLACLEYPGKKGGFVAPTAPKLQVGYDKFLKLVQPLGWVKRTTSAARGNVLSVTLINDATAQFVAAKRQGEATGSPLAGFDWHWAREDEQQYMEDRDTYEVDARGRVNANYKVRSSATNEPRHEFQARVKAYGTNPDQRVIRFSGYDNVFTPLSHWEAMKRGGMTDADFRRWILCEDVPQDGRVYPEFSYQESVQPLPQAGREITAELTAAKYGTPYSFVVGTDFGRQVNCSTVLVAFAAPGKDERVWYAVGEIVTRDQTTDWHAAEIKKWFSKRGLDVGRAIIIGDPHTNEKESDRSDYTILRNHGLNAVRANSGGRISRKHRYAMVNTLLRDATGKRRLFLAANELGQPNCTKMAQSLGSLLYAANGEAEAHGKDGDRDLTHYTDAPGYGLYVFEKFRGNPTPVETKKLLRYGPT